MTDSIIRDGTTRRRTTDWHEDFWERMHDSEEDDGVSAIRLIGEMLSDGLIWRDGDYLVGREGKQTFLTAQDQLLVRQIEEAAVEADNA